jgi:transcriptional regulator with XRE-family HTH domain
MKERIKELRKSLGITQQDFADKLGLKRNTIATYEIGKAVPSDRVVSDLCNKYNVNEEWLRTGEGEMFVALNRTQQIAQLTADLFKGEKDSFKERLLLALAKLDENEWKVLEKIAEDLTKEKD